MGQDIVKCLACGQPWPRRDSYEVHAGSSRLLVCGPCADELAELETMTWEALNDETEH